MSGPNLIEAVAQMTPRERWRVNYRYRRELAKWRREDADGDPLQLVVALRDEGMLARMAEIILATNSRAHVSNII
jgi:hypothetical protein